LPQMCSDIACHRPVSDHSHIWHLSVPQRLLTDLCRVVENEVFRNDCAVQ
jgi:hypothetical protein